MNKTYLSFSNQVLKENDVVSFQVLLFEETADGERLMKKSISYVDSSGYILSKVFFYEGKSDEVYDTLLIDIGCQMFWDLNCLEPDKIDTLENGNFLVTKLYGYRIGNKSEYEMYWEYDTVKRLNRLVTLVRPCYPGISLTTYHYKNDLLDQMVVRTSKDINIANIDSVDISKTVNFTYSVDSRLTNVTVLQTYYPKTIELEYIYLSNGLLDKIEIPALNSRIQIIYSN